MPLTPFSRRDLLAKGATLSLAGVGLLVGLNTKALAEDSSSTTSQDIDVLNEILGTEHEGIGAYQICLNRKLFHAGTAHTARLFQDHHKKHRDFLIEKIAVLGGAPAASKTLDQYSDDLDIVNLKSQKEALNLMVHLELGAANAYIGMLPSTNDHELVKVASRIAADEVIHWTTMSSLLGLPLPSEALSFGA